MLKVVVHLVVGVRGFATSIEMVRVMFSAEVGLPNLRSQKGANTTQLASTCQSGIRHTEHQHTKHGEQHLSLICGLLCAHHFLSKKNDDSNIR